MTPDEDPPLVRLRALLAEGRELKKRCGPVHPGPWEWMVRNQPTMVLLLCEIIAQMNDEDER